VNQSILSNSVLTLVLMLVASGTGRAITHSPSIQPIQPIQHGGDPGGGGPDPTGGGSDGCGGGGCVVAIH
jgi:hypothetical protein